MELNFKQAKYLSIQTAEAQNVQDQNVNEQLDLDIDLQFQNFQIARRQKRSYTLSNVKLPSPLNSINKKSKLNCISKNFYGKGLLQEDQFSKQFTIIDKIGEGANGIVFKVQKKNTDQFFAAKQIRTDDQEIVLSIQKEYEILQRINHQFIVKVHQFIKNEIKGLYYIIMDLLDDQTYITFARFPIFLKNQNLNKNKRQTICKSVMKNILETIQHIHENEIVHRDIQPNNVFVNINDFSIKIIDFGIAKVMTQENTSDFIIEEEKQSIYGHSQSSQEELIKNIVSPTRNPLFSPPYDLTCYKQDVWGFGLLLIVLIEKQTIDSKKAIEYVKVIRKRSEDELINNNNEYENQLKNLLIKCLEINSADRISVVQALHHDWFN